VGEMMEVKEINDRVELAKFLSDVNRNTGKVSFKITYTSTDGNLDIDRKFQKFCAQHSNNEYLAGIGLLLEVFEHYKDIRSMESYMKSIDDRLRVIEDGMKPKEITVVETTNSDRKTF
jgi:hypothetical protein